MQLDEKQSNDISAMKKRVRNRIMDKGAGSLYSSWRAKVFTKKGVLIGYPEKWGTFAGFCDDMETGWTHGKILRRIDTTKPFSKENCFWADKGSESNTRLCSLTYNGETKTLIEWSDIYRMSYNGMRQRYMRGKNYTAEEIIFGKRITSQKRRIQSISQHIDEQKRKDKVSKMLSSYRCKDKKRGLETTITNEELRHIIEKGKCIYCGDTENVGLDRIDNTKGHILDNVVPCCYECNVARGNNFTLEEIFIIGKAIAEVKRKRKNNEVLYNLRVVRVSNGD